MVADIIRLCRICKREGIKKSNLLEQAKLRYTEVERVGEGGEWLQWRGETFGNVFGSVTLKS